MELIDLIFNSLNQEELLYKNIPLTQIWGQVKLVVDRQKKIIKKMEMKKKTQKTLNETKKINKEETE